MTPELWLGIGALALSIAIPLVSKIYASARDEGSRIAAAQKMIERDATIAKLVVDVTAQDKAMALDRQAVNNMMIGLNSLRVDIDKRFDKIEDLISGARSS